MTQITATNPQADDASDLDIEALHPLDDHNRKLRDNAHPPQWTSPQLLNTEA